MKIAASRLPTEILLQIFSYLTYLRDLGKDWLSIFHEQVRILQVCATWRCAALSYRPLWTPIPTFNIEWSKLALKLSAPLPINVVIVSSEISLEPVRVFDDKSLDVLLPEISRLRTLILRTNVAIELGSGIRHALRAIYASETPALEKIDMDGFGVDDREADIYFQKILASPRPRVSHIKLSRGMIRKITGVRYQSLTELHVEGCTLCDSPFELLHCLSNLPSLAALSLVSAFSGGAYLRSIREPQIPRCSVLLPQLMNLRFRTSLIVVNCTLPYIHFSPRAEVELGISSEASGRVTLTNVPSRLNSIVQFFASHLEPWITDGVFLRAIRLCSRLLKDEGERIVIIAADELISDSEDVPTITLPHFKCLDSAIPSPPLLEIAHHSDLVFHGGFAQFFPFILNSVPALKRVRMLEVHVSSALRSEMQKSAIRLLTSFMSFEIIQITYDSWVPLSEAIVAHKNDNEQLLLPSLRELRIGGAHLSEASEHVERKIYPPTIILVAVRILVSWSSLRCIKIDSRDEHYGDGFLRALRRIVDTERGEVYM